MPIRIRCPKCKQLLQVPSKFAGQVVKCVKCEAKLRIPAPSAPQPGTPAADAAPKKPAPAAPKPPAPKPPATPPADNWSVDLSQPAPAPGPDAAAAENWSMDFGQGAPPLPSEEKKRSDENWSVDLSAGPATREQYRDARNAATADTYLDDDEEEDDDEFHIRPAGGEVEEMDLTPMVDVTFLLLIFFMITASFSMQKSLEVPPPDPEKEGAQQSVQTLEDFEQYSVIVQIDAQNRIFVDYEEVRDPRALIDAFEQKRASEQKNELIVEADGAAFEETVVTVIDAANEVGMEKIRIATSDTSGS